MLESAGLLIWWVWTLALPFYLFARKKKKKNQLRTSASSFWGLEGLAREEIAGS